MYLCGFEGGEGPEPQLRITDHDIEQIAKNWPKLEVFSFFYPVDDENTPCRKISLLSLDHLARHRPKLRMLDFPGIFHHPDVPETASVCQHALKKLSVQDVDIDEDMLARYATAVFPNAQLT